MKKKLSVQLLFIILMLFVIIIGFFVQCNNVSGKSTLNEGKPVPPTPNDSLAFGDTKWISDGLKGKIYLLPENTSKLPLFDTMQAVGTLYTHTLDVSNRSWETGFPGVPDRFEWFGIEYKGNFRVKKTGHYKFRILSDDGAKLFIDNKLVIDNDGLHPASSATGEADIDGDEHSITVQYYQGPRYYIALQLFATLDKENEEEQVFPGNNFILTTPGGNNTLLYLVIISILLVAVVIAYNYKQKRKIA